jgi:hypothetical protein
MKFIAPKLKVVNKSGQHVMIQGKVGSRTTTPVPHDKPTLVFSPEPHKWCVVFNGKLVDRTFLRRVEARAYARKRMKIA